jgi:hypothetical protein
MRDIEVSNPDTILDQIRSWNCTMSFAPFHPTPASHRCPECADPASIADRSIPDDELNARRLRLMVFARGNGPTIASPVLSNVRAKELPWNYLEILSMCGFADLFSDWRVIIDLYLGRRIFRSCLDGI